MVDEVVEEDGAPSPFIAMEFIEGKSLRDVIDGGPLKIDDAIRFGSAIAAALHAAHEKDIVHRDVKSANVMLTDTGDIKVLDFGLAKTAQSTMLTKTGSTLGTAAYMSPEQGSTMDVDRRSDIWSLGVVIYEMVAGKLPFGAAYEQAMVYSILNEDPEPLTAVRTGVPMELERIVTKCLMKDPALRYQHADELVADLAAVELRSSAIRTGMATGTIAGSAARSTAGGSSVGPVAGGNNRFPWWMALGTLVLGAVIGTGIGSVLTNEPAKDSDSSSYHLSIALPDGLQLSQGESAPLDLTRRILTISPDASKVAFLAVDSNGVTRLYVRSLEDRATRALPGTEGAYGPFFSPDGEWLAFFSDGFLRKAAVSGGAPLPLAPVSLPFDGLWLPDDRIVIPNQEGVELFEVRASGGPVSPFETRWIASPSAATIEGWVTGVKLRIRGRHPAQLIGGRRSAGPLRCRPDAHIRQDPVLRRWRHTLPCPARPGVTVTGRPAAASRGSCMVDRAGSALLGCTRRHRCIRLGPKLQRHQVRVARPGRRHRAATV